MSVATVVRELSAAQKSSSGVSLYTRWVNRPAGRVLAALAVTAGLSANTVTAISALVTTSGIVVLAAVPPTLGSGVLAALLLVLGFALDSADGQVSRYTRTGSAAGEWFDHVADAGKMVALHAGVLVGWYRFADLPGSPDEVWLLVPIAFQVVGVLMFSGGTLADLLERARRAARVAAAPLPAEGAAAPAPAPERPSLVRAVGLLPADYGVLACSFVLWGLPGVHRWAYLLLLAVNAVILVLLLRRWFRGLKA